MVTSIFGFLAVAAALLAAVLDRLYGALPSREMKRLAAQGEPLAQSLYRVVAFGASLRLLLRIAVVVLLPVGLFLLASSLPLAFALASFGAVVVAWLLLPALQLTPHTAPVASAVAPALQFVLRYVHAPLASAARFAGRYRHAHLHSGLFEKEDVALLLDQQAEQADNRVSPHDLLLMRRALYFGDKTAADIVQPRKSVRMLDAGESLGPILLDELHHSGQPAFIVHEGGPDHVVGTLSLQQAVEAKQTGHVRDVMQSQVCYVHEDFSLPQVADALAITRQSIAVVVNGFDEVVGIVTLQQLLQELFGEAPAADAPNYTDRAVVASYRLHAAEAPAEEKTPAEEPSSAEPVITSDPDAPSSSTEPAS